MLTARRYMIIKNLVPAENCDAVTRDMLQLLGWAKDDPSTWYTYRTMVVPCAGEPAWTTHPATAAGQCLTCGRHRFFTVHVDSHHTN